MIREQKIKNVTWISIISPGMEEVNTLKERFPETHPLVLEELLTLTIRPQVENYENHLYMVLHFPKFIHGPEKSVSYELDFILLQEALVTVQYDEIDIVENLWHECEVKSSVEERYGRTPIHLLYYFLRLFFSNALKELDKIQEEIDLIEEKVFSGPEKEVLEDISLLKRDVLDFRRAFKPQHLTLESLKTQGVHLYGEKVKPFLDDLIGEYFKVWNLLETHKETLDALYDTHHQLLTARTSESMRVFTILAFISFIPTVIANIYGMNISNLPFSQDDNAFWIVQGLMVSITLLVYAALKWRKLI